MPRIVCSDDEDENEAVVLPSKDIRQAMHPPATAPRRGRMSKAGDDDDDDDDDEDDGEDDKDEEEDEDEDEQQTRTRSARSTRSSRSTASSTKESRRQEQIRELQSKLGKGLDGALSSEDDGSDDDEGEGLKREKFTFSAARDPNKPSSAARGSVVNFFRGGRDNSDAVRRPRKPPTPEPSSGEDDDDVDNFILDSDEEREEEEERLRTLEKKRLKEKKKRRKEKEARRQAKEKEERQKKKRRSVGDDDDEDERELVRSARRSSTSSGGKKRISTSDDEEEDDGVKEKAKKSSNNGRKRSRVGDDDDDDDDDDDEEDEEEDDEDDSSDDDSSDDEEALDGPALYWQVDAMRAQKQEHNLDTMPIRKNFSVADAMRMYIEMIANAHVDPEFMRKMMQNPQSSPYSSYIAAARQLENKLCTYRESLVGSGAWNSLFMSEISKRPFFIISPASFQGMEKCSACNRTSNTTIRQIYLFGVEYPSSQIWSSTRWDKGIPDAAFFRSREGGAAGGGQVVVLSDNDDEQDDDDDDDGEEDADDDDEDDESGNDRMQDRKAAQACKWWKQKWPGDLTRGKETRWFLSGHCCNRTQLYHTLLHYKLRLILKIREKLQQVGGSVGEALRDANFVSNEVTRFENLMTTAERMYGGREALSRFQSDCWNDDMSSSPTTSAGAMRSGGRKSSGGGGATSTFEEGGEGGAGILQWLVKGDGSSSAGV